MRPTIVSLLIAVAAGLAPVARAADVAGVFRQGQYVDRLDDINSAGGRVGAYLQAGRNTYIGGGVVYEKYLGCNSEVYRSCSDTYPELSITFAF